MVVSPLWGLFYDKDDVNVVCDGCFPVMGVILTQRSNKYYHVGCFPVMGVILGLPHKINEHNNLTRLEKLELALLDQHE